jgi:hypothetical protein
MGAGRVTRRQPHEEILARAAHQWLDFRQVLDIVDRSAPDRDEDHVMASALQLLDRLLTDDQIRIGDVTETGFSPWEASADSVLVRIRTTWLDLDCQVRPGDVCWIEATPDGRMIGQEVLERRQLLAPLAVT